MSALGQIARGVVASAAVLALIVAAAVLLERSQPDPITASKATIAEPPLANLAVDGVIRVALSDRPVSALRLRVEGPCQIVAITDDGSSEPIQQQTSLPEQSISIDGDRIEIAGEGISAATIEIVPEQSPSIWIDDRKYRGTVRLHRVGRAKLLAVNVLPLEDYVAAVVDAEMPAAFPIAARQAQAIVARTYAISCRREATHRLFDVYASPRSQNYLGVVYRGTGGRLLAGETPAGRAAAEATARIVCTHQGRLFRTFYSACCGGRTLSGDVIFGDSTPTLCGVTCGGCDAAPFFRWQRVAEDAASFDRLTGKARTRLSSFGSIKKVQSVDETSVAISDGRRTARLKTTEVRTALRLPSLLYEISGDGDRLLIRGRGHGHGVGLCQWGAKGLAERGLTAEEILKHYYPGCELAQVEQPPSGRLAALSGMPYIQRENPIPR